jgi:TatD DNase family protein
MIDTHCHIHDSEFAEKSLYTADELISRAKDAGVAKLVCVGTSLTSSLEAKEFCRTRQNCYYSVALHPHEAENYSSTQLEQQMEQLGQAVEGPQTRLVAIGECGLDYFYHSNTKVHQKQEQLFRKHIELAQKFNLPMIFHIRDSLKQEEPSVGQAFSDFFRIVDEYEGVRGVVHSFSATTTELDGVLERGFYVGLNGIMTFTKDQNQLEAAKKIPLENLLLETDAPFLTPKPFRGSINEPKHVIIITQFLSELRGESQALLAKQTSKNATLLFNL